MFIKLSDVDLDEYWRKQKSANVEITALLIFTASQANLGQMYADDTKFFAEVEKGVWPSYNKTWTV